MRPFSFSVTGIGSVGKPIYTPSFVNALRFTIKVRTLGSNSFIAIGDFSVQEFRFNSAQDSFTFVDLPKGFDIKEIWAKGDSAAADGILEVVGIQGIE